MYHAVDQVYALILRIIHFPLLHLSQVLHHIQYKSGAQAANPHMWILSPQVQL